MPWRFAQPLAAQCNGVSKTAADCSDDLNSLPGNCPTYLARNLRPATKPVNMILFRMRAHLQNGSWRKALEPTGAGRARCAMSTWPFTLSHCPATAVSLLLPLTVTNPTTNVLLVARVPTIWYDLLLECYSSTSWLKLEINLSRNGPKGKICILHKACCPASLGPLLLPVPSVTGTGLVSQDTVGWRGQLNMSKGEQLCSTDLGSGVPSPSPDAFRGLTFSQSDIGTI